MGNICKSCLDDIVNKNEDNFENNLLNRTEKKTVQIEHIPPKNKFLGNKVEKHLTQKCKNRRNSYGHI